MLSECRTIGYPYSIPEFSLEDKDVEPLMDELRAFHDEFSGCFQRSETRASFYHYMVGQFSEMDRKSIEPIALRFPDVEVRSMQRAISDAVWDEDKMLDKYRSLLSEDLSDSEGVLIFDETAFPKKGDESVGVGRQYCGSLGKVENCQVGVFAAYASRHGYSFLDKRLFIPEKWFGPDHEGRRKRCQVPADARFQTKPQLAAEMLELLCRQKDLPIKYIVADTIYGASPDFIAALEKHPDKTYFVGIHANTLCRLRRPITKIKKYKYAGQERIKEVVVGAEDQSVTLADIALNLNDFFWYRKKVSEGTKGPIEYEFAKRRVVLMKNGKPGKEVWLVIRRSLSGSPDYRYYISNASRNARLSLLVWLSGVRWAIEQAFEETKTELGMDQYEVRKFPGWNHHILTCMLAHFFLWHINIRLGKKSTSHYHLPT